MNTFIESFLELIYPEKNICCMCDIYDETIDDKYICADCERKIKKIIPPYCIKCCKPINYSSSTNLCPDCISFEKFFEESRSPFLYEGIIKKGIYNLKYYNKPYYLRYFGNALLQYMNDNDYNNFDYIIPVPLHPLKLKSRGYNQSELIAKYIAKKLNITFIDGISRIKQTGKQSTKSKEDRRRSLENAFKIKKSKKYHILKNSTILLVDDIYTTGSTANECSKALLDYGISKVYVITIAR
ncbi:MAG: ComF family protein [Tissierellia bacterium]|nr:ComF family protein [Tissierellia bacterium]MDD4780372.1 ComF family protein [Tissierellia bacterium]